MKWIFFIFLFLSSRLFCQTNLVPNSSFEDCTTCPPNGFAPIGGQFIPYNAELIGWFNPNTHSPDYFRYSSDTNTNIDAIQSPHTDSSYVGIAVYDANSSNLREYVSTQLLDTLIENKYYLIEFYCSLAENLSRFSSNNLAIYFSDTALHSTTSYYFDLDASIKYFNNEVIQDTTNWIKFSGIYQSHGGEKFLTLGNFNTDIETTEGIEYLDGTIWQAYYIIDDVSVIPLDSIVSGISVHAGPDQTVYIGDTVFIGEKITNLPANWFKLDGTPVVTNISGLYVWPEETTTYIVTMSLNGFYSTDTVTVFVEGVGIEEEKAIDFLVYPNPNSGTIKVSGSITKNTKVKIVSLEGKELFSEELQIGTKEISIQTGLKSGGYLLYIQTLDGEIFYRVRIIIE